MIKLYINMDDVYFNFDTAISCGLIINELVTNSIKHAFPWFKTPKSLNETFGNIEFGKYKIEIRLESSNENYCLIVADNGFGLPENVDFKSPDTLGLSIVNNLVQQLDGTIKLDKTYGTKFTISFKDKLTDDF